MNKVWIVQALCGPARHCVMAVAFEGVGSEEEKQDARQQLEFYLIASVGTHHINPWCGLCGAGIDAWRIEVEPTQYATLKDAMPELRRLEAEQSAARVAIQAAQKAQLN